MMSRKKQHQFKILLMFTFQGLIDVTFHVLYSITVIERVPAVLSRHTVPCNIDRHFARIQVFCGNVI